MCPLYMFLDGPSPIIPHYPTPNPPPLWLFSLAMQKLLNLMRSHLFILSFMSLALGDVSVRMLLRGMYEIFLPMFSSRTFMVSRLIFQSFIQLEFILVYGISW